MLTKALLSLSLAAGACLLLFSCQERSDPRPPETLRVACVGDSITYGKKVEERWRYSYPSQLGGLLGRGWEVRNFGVSGATALMKGPLPYRQTKEFTEALAFLPHVVIIKLGTNDARPLNWRHKREYARDYLALVRSFQALGTRPGIWLCTLAPAYGREGGRADRVIQEEVIPRIREIARRTGLPVIDLNSALLGRKDLFADGVHPNGRGARVMAETVYEAITGEKRERKER